MKQKNRLKDLLIGTGGVLLLTLFQLFRDGIHPSVRGYRDGLELLILWLCVIVAWVIYLVSLIRKGKKDKEEEPWNQKEKDPW